MRQFFLSLVYIASALCVGAHAESPSAWLVSPSEDLTPPTWVSRENLIRDLEALAQVAQSAYAGPDLVHALKATQVQLKPFMAPARFCRFLNREFQRVGDGHLSARLLNDSCASSEGQGRVGRNLVPIRQGYGIKHLKTSSGRPITALAIASFMMAEDSRWKGFVEAVAAIQHAGESFILDLRGNTGGDNAMARTLAQSLYGLSAAEPVPTPAYEREWWTSPEAFALQANAWAFEILLAQSKGQAVPKEYFEERERQIDEMHTAELGGYPHRQTRVLPQPSLDPAAVFGAEVYVLIDRECASACEMALEYLEKLPRRILVGENSAGAVMYGEVGRVRLPHSRVLVTLASFASRYSDHRQIDGRGYSPQISVPPGRDALGALLLQIQ